MTFKRLSKTTRAIEVPACYWSPFDRAFTIPAGTAVGLVEGADGIKGDQWAVADVALLADLSGNTHDPKYRYAFVNAGDVDLEPPVEAWPGYGLHGEGTGRYRKPEIAAEHVPGEANHFRLNAAGQAAVAAARRSVTIPAAVAATLADRAEDWGQQASIPDDERGEIAAAVLAARAALNTRSPGEVIADFERHTYPDPHGEDVDGLERHTDTPPTGRALISAAHLATLADAAKAYHDDLESGLGDGTYELPLLAAALRDVAAAPEIDRRAFGTILAALRYWQRKAFDGEGAGPFGDEVDIAEDGGDLTPLSVEEIDALCEALNCG